MIHLIRRFLTIFTLFSFFFLLCNNNSPSAPGKVTFPDTNPPGSVCSPIEPVNVSHAQHVVGDGTPASCTEAALRAALLLGDTIRCNCGNIPPTITISGEFTIRKNTVFDGGGITLDGNGSTRFFRKKCVGADQNSGVHLTIQNIKLRNGKADSCGGAIYNEVFGSFSAINVDFIKNSCARTTGPDIGGGALYSCLQTNVTLSGCNFIGNYGSNGGIGNSMAIINCAFDSNTAMGNGGGADAGPTGRGGIGGSVYIDNVDVNGINNFLTVCGSTFSNNKSNSLAGAIFAYFQPAKASTGSIDRCTFDNNTAQTQGGAAWFYRENNDAGRVSITNVTFSHNKVLGEWGLGGALGIATGPIFIMNCTFAYNSSRHFACAIKNSGPLYIANTVLDSNMLAPGPNNNVWAGVAIDKSTNLTDDGGNLEYPTLYLNGTWIDSWLTENPGILQADPCLLSLANNGGPTQTMALPSVSPAINKGTATNAPTTDQRGFARIGIADIGAYEFGAQ